MPNLDQGPVGFLSAIPPTAFLEQLTDDDRRNEFVAEQVRTRIALLIRALREQREWSQAKLGEELGKPQSVVSRLEDPDYGKLSVQTLFEAAAAFRLPLYIDMPNWDEWFRLMSKVSGDSLQRQEFDLASLASLRDAEKSAAAYDDPQVSVATPVQYNDTGAADRQLQVIAVSDKLGIMYHGQLNSINIQDWSSFASHLSAFFGGDAIRQSQLTLSEIGRSFSALPAVNPFPFAQQRPRAIALQEQVT